MTENPAADAAIAARIRAAQAELHAAVDAANEAGICVYFGISTWPGRPKKTHTHELRIERSFDWDDERKDIVL